MINYNIKLNQYIIVHNRIPSNENSVDLDGASVTRSMVGNFQFTL